MTCELYDYVGGEVDLEAEGQTNARIMASNNLLQDTGLTGTVQFGKAKSDTFLIIIAVLSVVTIAILSWAGVAKRKKGGRR